MALVKRRKQVTKICKASGCNNTYIRYTDDLKTRCCSAQCTIDYSKQKVKEKDQEKVKSITEWKDELQVVINWVVVNGLDLDKPCISHPEKPKLFDWHAGHCYSVGSCGDLRFNFHNIHKQSDNANIDHGGGPAYFFGLSERYGSNYLEMVLGLKLKWKGIAKNCYTISNIKDVYLPNARRLKKDIQKGHIYTREQLNEMIGIYVPENSYGN